MKCVMKRGAYKLEGAIKRGAYKRRGRNDERSIYRECVQ